MSQGSPGKNLRPKVHNPIHPALRAKMEAQRAVDQERRRKEYAQTPERIASSAVINSPRWRAFSKWFLRQPENALCVECKKNGRVKPATHTDHIKPRATHPELTWKIENLQPLCKPCRGC